MKIIGTIKCIYRIWIDDLWRNIMIFFLFIILTVLGFSICASLDELTITIQVYKNLGFDRGIMYAVESEADVSISEIKENLEKLDCVDKVDCPTGYFNGVGIKGVASGLQLVEYRDLKLDEKSISLISGRMPVKENEVLISENLTKLYRVGDTFEIEWFESEAYLRELAGSDAKEPTQYEYYSSCPVTIVGVISDKSPTLLSGFGRVDFDCWIDHLFTSPSAILERMREQAGSIDVQGYLLASSINYETWNNDIIAGNRLIIYPSENMTQDMLRENLPIEIAVNCKTFNELKQEFIDKYSNRIRVCTEIAIAFFIAVFVLMTSCFAIVLRKKRNELITYYLCGCSWKKTVALASLAYCPSIILGMISGYRFIPIVDYYVHFGFARIRMWYFAYTYGLIVFLMGIILGMFYSYAVGRSPIEMKRGV